MKKNNLIEIIILFFLGIAVLISLFLPQLSHIKNHKRFTQISMILSQSDYSLWSNVRLGMEQAANQLNAEVRFLTLSTANDANEQIKLINHEIERGADAIIIVPANPSVLSEWILKQKDICPIVCIESSISGADLTISPNPSGLGKALANAVINQWSGEKICLVDSSCDRTGISSRIDAAEKALNQFNVPVERLNLSNCNIKSDLQYLLEQYKSCTMVTFEPSSTELVARYKESNSLDFKIYGTGISTYITNCMEHKTINAVATWRDYAVGYLAVENAILLASGEKVKLDYLPFEVVDCEDMYETENQKLLFPVIS